MKKDWSPRHSACTSSPCCVDSLAPSLSFLSIVTTLYSAMFPPRHPRVTPWACSSVFECLPVSLPVWCLFFVPGITFLFYSLCVSWVALGSFVLLLCIFGMDSSWVLLVSMDFCFLFFFLLNKAWFCSLSSLPPLCFCVWVLILSHTVQHSQNLATWTTLASLCARHEKWHYKWKH